MAIIVSLILLISSAASSAAADGGYGFSVELIHRDFLKFPLFNASETHYQRIADALRRSISRGTVSPPDTGKAPIYTSGGAYVVKISLGTPPFSIVAIADTGSDIIWTQCKPCPNCYQQIAPMFDPSKSSTYKTVSCSSPTCSITGPGNSCSSNSVCEYSISYGDGSHSNGDIAVDTLTMDSTSGRPMAFPRTAIGCGHDNAGSFDSKVSGIVGLGHGSASLVQQMGPATGGKFSYCLAPIGNSNYSSYLNFGSNAIVSGSGAVSTPIYTGKGYYKVFYVLKIEAMSVGSNKYNFSSSSPFGTKGNIIIDSGTTLTFLQPDIFASFSEAISEVMDLKSTTSPIQTLEFCYESTTDDYKVPPVIAHFKGGKVNLKRENLFIRVADDVVCLAFVGNSEKNSMQIYGNIAQTNFLVGYNIKKSSVSFKPANCAAS
ncbi:aspartic proteinase CDR1-like [Cucurbita moschata]|uniref:Aspartic proteinase CDR1-like n=1 Tax=Cucurbita moschata TaxID=3662 RepID=A0A6J1H6D4_CUCMO|nr:aspartic proteinase CDR1-like [Cucurbita moschata]